MRRVPYKWIVATVFVFGMFMDIMDTTIINVALPTLARDFHASDAQIEWVVVGYLLSLAVWIPASGWIGDRVGTKKTFLFALAVFTIGSALCGQAHSLNELIAFRLLQGVGGGMLTPVGTAMLFRAFPPVERATASTMLIIPAVLAPAMGPIIGGWLVTSASWRWIFYVNVPVGIVGFVVGARYLREDREGSAGPFDLPGFVLSGGALALVLYALSEAPQNGWRSASVVITGTLGVLLFVVLVVVETRVDHPMLALRLYRERMFRNANIVLTLTYGSFAAVLFLMPLFLQTLRGLTALQSGLTTFPQALGVIVSTQVVGRAYHRVGPRRLIFYGMLGMSIVSLPFIFMTLETNLWWIRATLFVRGMFMACAFVPLQAATYANITPADTGRASAIFSTQRQVAAALGVSTLATVWISSTKAFTRGVTSAAGVAHGALNGFRLAFGIADVLIACAAVSALLIRDADAAASMRPRTTDRVGTELAVAAD
jgi:EmrB/QacA subfamily drug resistance transporter